MKASFKFILAALAATAALTACTKEITSEEAIVVPSSQAAEGTRVIAVSFDPSTKTILKGLKPEFVAGDKILVTNGKAAPDTCEVTVTDDGVAAISTELAGPLTAVYPATAAKMKAGNPNQIDASFVSSEQTGKFADANICMASVEEFGTSTYFKNEYALFVITPPEGADSLTIRSLCQIQQETGQRTGGKTSICMSDVKKESCIVTISGEPVEDGQYYVALSGGVNLSDLSFEVSFNENDSIGSIKGIPACKIAEQAGADIGSESYNVYNKYR